MQNEEEEVMIQHSLDIVDEEDEFFKMEQAKEEKLPCHKMLYTRCKYDHDPRVLMREWQKFTEERKKEWSVQEDNGRRREGENSTTVKVEDGRQIQIHGKISLIIGFKSGNGDITCATLCLRILDGLSLPLVIGIVSILEHFKDLYISMLQMPDGKYGIFMFW
jgi:hypothetical protein